MMRPPRVIVRRVLSRMPEIGTVGGIGLLVLLDRPSPWLVAVVTCCGVWWVGRTLWQAWSRINTTEPSSE
jgi:hypothetical protein